MDINELIEELENIRENFGNIEVRIAQQPSWPMEYSISGIVVNDPTEQIDSEDDDDNDVGDDSEPVVFIGEGSQLGYLSGRVNSLMKQNGW